MMTYLQQHRIDQKLQRWNDLLKQTPCMFQKAALFGEVEEACLVLGPELILEALILYNIANKMEEGFFWLFTWEARELGKPIQSGEYKIKASDESEAYIICSDIEKQSGRNITNGILKKLEKIS